MDTTFLELGTGVEYQTLIISENGDELNSFWDETLRDIGCNCTYTNFSQWRNDLDAESIELVILDGGNNPEKAILLCREFCQSNPIIPLVTILTRTDLTEHGAAWHKAGAQNFLRLDATRVEVETVLTSELKIAKLKKELESLKLQKVSSHQYDTVTQFLTRRHFFVDAHRECGRARRYGHSLSCIMISINYFDDYGKNFGQACSNYLLRSVAALMRQWTRESDIVARFATNKVVALLPETDISGAVMVRERILDTIAEHKFEWDGKMLPVSISIGEAERSHAFDSRLPDLESPAPISVREEIAQLLEDSDMALAVAQKSSARPAMFIEYSHAELPDGG
jgi:diguanylate cyclase (GGDEF)-like protein